MSDGLITAYLLDGHGGGNIVGWNEIRGWTPDQGVLWVHLDYTDAEAREWMERDSGLDAITLEALLEPETRPRSEISAESMLVVLRGVNLNPGADPEDMVSIRIWVEANRVISLRRRRLLSIDDVRQQIARGQGPQSAGELLVKIVESMVSRVSDVVEAIDETVDRLEHGVLENESRNLRPQLASVRRETIALRRYLAPQRDAMHRLTLERAPLLTKPQRLELREEADRITRCIEDLDSARDRAAVTQEELTSRLSEQMNARMYVLSLVAGIFLPISFLTGLLGVNVGGIPLAESPWGFLLITALLVLITGLQVLLFRRKGWM